MAMQTAFRSEERFTQEEFREWLAARPASDVNRYELVEGRIVMSPPAAWVHAGVGSTLGALIRQHVRDLDLGYTFDSSAGYEMPSGETIEPDFSFVSKERFSAGPKPARDGFLRIVPDLVVEILSDSTARRDRTEKREIYGQNGVDEYWLVDTDRHEVTVLVRRGGVFASERVFAHGRIVSSVLPAVALDVESLFADLPPA